MATLLEMLTAGLERHQAGLLSEAEGFYRQVLELDPNQADALHLLGMVAHQGGRSGEAAALVGKAIALRPSVDAYHNNLGLVYRAQGRFSEAADCYRRALQLNPDLAEAHNNLGNVFRDLDQAAAAEACYRRAVQLEPGLAEAHKNLGGALRAQGRLAEAMVCCRRAVELSPGSAEAHNSLGNVLEDQGQLAEAAGCYRRALAAEPGNAEAYKNLGNVLKDAGKPAEAAACYENALQLRPGDAQIETNLGNALQEQGRLEAAADCYRRALRAAPELAETRNNLGMVLQAQGLVDEAMVCYEQALQGKPDLIAAASNRLFAMHYRPGVTPAELLGAHAEYDRQYAGRFAVKRRPLENNRDPERRLRLGFVSMDFGRHPVGYLSIRPLEDLDRDQYEVICYSHRARDDEMTARFRRAADAWRDTCGWTDERLAEQIRTDRIDILFDLAGHTAGHRLLVFARKPAPVAITWIGYVGTTGLEAMDYLLADGYHVPEGKEALAREKVLRLSDGYVCYDPPEPCPPVAPLPAARRGHVTFGSFNNPAKLNPQVLAVWARVLQRVASARLVLQGAGLDEPATGARFRRLLEEQGIGPERVELRGASPRAQLLAAYHELDVALDPFPYSGGVTTCEALWMGVPVVTWPGETFASRHAFSHLSNVGLRGTIAGSLDEYVELAAGLAADLPGLAALRGSLRRRMADSPLCDRKRFAASLAKVLRDVWRAWAGA